MSKLITSIHQDSLGTALNISVGFFDSSFIPAAYKDTAKVRAIRNINENQKYTALVTDGILL